MNTTVTSNHPFSPQRTAESRPRGSTLVNNDPNVIAVGLLISVDDRPTCRFREMKRPSALISPIHDRPDKSRPTQSDGSDISAFMSLLTS